MHIQSLLILLQTNKRGAPYMLYEGQIHPFANILSRYHLDSAICEQDIAYALYVGGDSDSSVKSMWCVT